MLQTCANEGSILNCHVDRDKTLNSCSGEKFFAPTFGRPQGYAPTINSPQATLNSYLLVLNSPKAALNSYLLTHNSPKAVPSCRICNPAVAIMSICNAEKKAMRITNPYTQDFRIANPKGRKYAPAINSPKATLNSYLLTLNSPQAQAQAQAQAKPAAPKKSFTPPR
jgi:hypothetical protein